MDPQRKAPRQARRLRFAADDAFAGEVLDISAVGLRVLVVKARQAPQPGSKLLSGTLSLEDGSHIRIKVKVARATRDGGNVEVGLEIAEADKSFFDALPKLRRDTGETPALKPG
jgi:hypothetical protein